MLMPSIFGENLFDDDWMDFPFERFDRDFWGKKNPLYGKNAKNMMKTDIREHEAGYELDIYPTHIPLHAHEYLSSSCFWHSYHTADFSFPRNLCQISQTGNPSNHRQTNSLQKY